jgi:alpha-galactosidase
VIDRKQRDIACVPAEPAKSFVYAEGWQSWSIAGTQPATAAPDQMTGPDAVAIECQYATAPPPGVHQGSGLLAVDPGDGGPAEIFAAVNVDQQVPVIQARRCDGYLMVSADGPVTRRTDTRGGGITGALGRWAAEFADRIGVPPDGLRTVPPVWCPGYQHHDHVTEQDILANLAAMNELHVPVGVLQIDGGYQAAPGDWLSPSGRFTDLPYLVDRIRGTGRRAGIWIAPLLVGRSSELLRGQPGWVVRHPGSGDPLPAGTVCGQECTVLDVTHPGAAHYLAAVLSTMRNWGIDYFKVDYIYPGAYEGRRHEDMTGVAAYRRALRLIRDAIGPQALLLGSGAPILPSVGLLDAMRVGPGIAASPAPADGQPAQQAAARNTVARAWQQGRFWVNDPDCLMARPGVQRRADWAALVERFGGLRASSDGLRGLDSWGLETTRRLLVPSPTGPVV